MALQIKDYDQTTYVTGMRAFAALAVVLIHAGGGGLRGLGSVANTVADMGRGGVSAFFVISGFSVAASFNAAGGYGRYLFLRFMRLAPLYYFWLLAYGLLLGRTGYWAEVYGLAPLAYDLFVHLAFLHAFSDQTANSMLGVEWSLAVEMFWYLFLPGLWRVVQRGRGAILVAASLVFYFLIMLVFGKYSPNNTQVMRGPLWMPFVHFPSFALGAWALALRSTVAPSDRRGGVLMAFVLLIAYPLAPLWLGHAPVDLLLLISAFTFLLLVFGTNDDPLCRRLFMSKFVLVLGTLSYGIYLTHILAVHFLADFFPSGAGAQLAKFFCVAALSSSLAWLTYLGVERPFERWAKRFYSLVNKSASSN